MKKNIDIKWIKIFNFPNIFFLIRSYLREKWQEAQKAIDILKQEEYKRILFFIQLKYTNMHFFLFSALGHPEKMAALRIAIHGF